MAQANGIRLASRPLNWPLVWLLVAAIGLPALLLAASGWLAWQGSWREARNEVAQEADAGG